MFQPIHWVHHQVSISESKMFVHNQLVCQRDPVQSQSKWYYYC
jgi:hypothetical protein